MCARDKAALKKKSAVTPSTVCSCCKEPEKRCLKVSLLLQVFLLLSWHKDASHSAADCVRQEGAFRPQLTLQNRREIMGGHVKEARVTPIEYLTSPHQETRENKNPLAKSEQQLPRSESQANHRHMYKGSCAAGPDAQRISRLRLFSPEKRLRWLFLHKNDLHLTSCQNNDSPLDATKTEAALCSERTAVCSTQ